MGIDLDFRPEHPFRLKSITREAIRRGEEYFVREFRRAFERAHPTAMGGNYLPAQEVGDVEVARIQLKSTTADVGCVWVSQAGQWLVYRFVDEYEGETLNKPSHVRVKRPLTLGQLARFIARVWGLREALEFNFEDQFEGRLSFFTATSADYQELDAALCSLAEDWFDEAHGMSQCPGTIDPEVDGSSGGSPCGSSLPSDSSASSSSRATRRPTR